MILSVLEGHSSFASLSFKLDIAYICAAVEKISIDKCVMLSLYIVELLVFIATSVYTVDSALCAGRKEGFVLLSY